MALQQQQQQQQQQTIGTSLLHGGGGGNEHSIPMPIARPPPQQQQDDYYPPPTTPCLLLASDRTSCQRIILHGPRKSGRTSLAMNVAYSLASSRRTTTSCCPSCCVTTTSSCQCIAATIFRPARKETSTTTTAHDDDDDEDLFPLACHPILIPTTRKEKDFESRYQTLQTNPNNQESWDPQVLQRIQVHYVSSVRELLKELLAFLNRPQAAACQALIIDDLDVIAGVVKDNGHDNHHHHHHLGTISSSMMQILAIAVDTAQALQRLHGTTPIVLATTKSSKQGVVAPWMDTMVSLQASTTSNSNSSNSNSGTNSSDSTRSLWHQRLDDDSIIVVSTWKAEILHPARPDDGQQKPMSVEYAVTNSAERGLQIHWMDAGG